jgi:hypothetical protein
MNMRTETEIRSLAEEFSYKITKSKSGEVTLIHPHWDDDDNVLAEGLKDIEAYLRDEELYDALEIGKLELKAVWEDLDKGYDINEDVLNATLDTANYLIEAVERYRSSKKEERVTL